MKVIDRIVEVVSLFHWPVSEMNKQPSKMSQPTVSHDAESDHVGDVIIRMRQLFVE